MSVKVVCECGGRGWFEMRMCGIVNMPAWRPGQTKGVIHRDDVTWVRVCSPCQICDGKGYRLAEEYTGRTWPT